MKLKRIIFPEIIHGRRGHPDVIKHYKEQSKSVRQEIDSNGRMRWRVAVPTDPRSGKPDANVGNHYLLIKIFRERGGKTYLLNRDFAQALSQIDREMPLDILPKNFTGYIQFSDNTFQDDTGPVDGALVWLTTVKDLGYSWRDGTGASDDDLAIAISYLNRNPEDDGYGPAAVCKFATVLSKQTIESTYENLGGTDAWLLRDIDPKAHALRLPIIRAIINAVIYIHSADPDIEKLRPLVELSHTKRIAERKLHTTHNECTVPVTLLNWQYHAVRAYSVDQGPVRAHPRWQRCGVGFSQVKLIMIDEYIRHYKANGENE